MVYITFGDIINVLGTNQNNLPMRSTKTTNRLHFSDLEPLRFEDLCLNIIHRRNEWKDIRHYGRKRQ